MDANRKETGRSLKPAHNTAWHWRPNSYAHPGLPQNMRGPFIAGVKRRVMAMAVIEQIVGAISGMHDAVAVCRGSKAFAKLPNDRAKLRLGDLKTFAVR